MDGKINKKKRRPSVDDLRFGRRQSVTYVDIKKIIKHIRNNSSINRSETEMKSGVEKAVQQWLKDQPVISGKDTENPVGHSGGPHGKRIPICSKLRAVIIE
jgi:hypothetical protein